MKIQDAKRVYTAQRHDLWEKREPLAKLLEDPRASRDFDRVEISRELAHTDAQYDAVDKAIQRITAAESRIFGEECSRQQYETEAKAAEDRAKIMEVYRRIASGAKVPAKDQQKLMDYDMKLYMAARTAALLARQDEEEYDSLWEDEEPGEQRDPHEVAGNAEIDVPHPSAVAASVEPPSEEDVYS